VAFTGTLREFQKPAVDKALDRGNLLVALDMGLGKTVVAIAIIEELLEREEVRDGILVVPASLKYQWESQIKAFTEDALVLVVDGPPEQRRKQYEQAFKYEYVILTYDQVLNDWLFVRKLGRDFIVLDEAVAIKNFTAKRTKKIKRLDANYKIALTGQPIENRPEELFSIMEWVDEDVLGRFDIFDRTFIKRNTWGGVERYKNLPLLHERMKEAMVRKKRTDDDVKDEMPDVVEDTVLVKMDRAGRSLDERIRHDLLAELETAMRFSAWDVMSHYGGGEADGSDLQARGRIMSRLTCLRMLCDHPDLLRKSAMLYDGTLHLQESMQAGSAYASELLEDGALDHDFGSPKLDVLVEQLDEILSENPANKIVVFSFFKGSLDLIADATAKLSRSVKFTGDLTARAREDVKVEFQKDPKTRLFLSSDAGGVGVDLPQANYLCSFDLPWSAGKLDQRNSRIIRLSTEWDYVTLINFLIKGSIEERQYRMLEQKRAIASAVMDGAGIDAKGQLQLSLTTLSEFLNESAV
jgi:SNF2 family DNA or RNA helicase